MKIGKSGLLLIAVFFLLQSCSKSNRENFDSDFSLFRDYITSFSSGLVSAESDIQVGLAFTKTEWLPNQELDRNLFTISPNVDGKVIAISNNLIAFQPSEKLNQDTEYNIVFHLSKCMKVSKELEEFKFSVKAIKQDFIVETLDLQSYSSKYQFLRGMLKTSDNMDFETAKKLVEASQNNNKLSVKFEKAAKSATEFYFIIDSIERFSQSSEVEINWDGDDYDIDQKGTTKFEIPGKDTFKVIGMKPITNGTQALYINFSDPLKKEQVFEGLVAVGMQSNMTYSTEGNLLKIFFEQTLDKAYFVEVFQGIENFEGNKLPQSHSEKVSFSQLKPEVKFVKSGTILPSSNNLKVNFQAVNLKAVDVKVYQIYENNVLQFLQDNKLNGNYDLRKVALPIAKKTISLTVDNLKEMSKWNSYSIDMASLIKPQKGAIYRLEISFKKAYSLYKCDPNQVNKEAGDDEGEEEETTVEEEEERTLQEDIENFDQEYSDYYDYDYEWRQAQSPCSNSFYYNKRIVTNILATDLGVIAKRGENKSYFFAVNNIVTTEPVADATIDVYNFQQQKLASYKTDSEGTATFVFPAKAFFAVVKKDDNTTYVKLDDGNSLSVSNFDIDGEKLQKGLKGYIYGERGVWRPGDKLYLSFILNDLSSKLPSAHPIKFRLSNPNGKIVYQTMQTYNELNHYKFEVQTQQNAPTGNWEAMVSVGGAKFYKSIKLETIKPNRLKIRNNLEGKLLSVHGKNSADIQVNWMHGAIARDLKIDIQAKFSQQRTTFKGFDNYTFDDPSRKFTTEQVTVFSGKVNNEGKASVGIHPTLQSQAPGMLKAAFITKVYENGGDFSTDVITTNYSPYNTYVGVKSPEPNKYGMLETGRNNTFNIVTVDENGRPKAARNLEVKVFKVEWRWWWDASDDFSNYTSGTSNVAYTSDYLSTSSSGKTSFTLNVDEEDWGRYLIMVTDPVSGHATGITALIDSPYWSGKTKNEDGSASTMLMFSTDKKQYNVGETAKISFPSSEGSRALISIENGSEVVQTLWAETKKGETQVSLPITEKMAPNVYINISLLQPHASTKNDSPIRMYGIIPIEVINKKTILEPTIQMPAVLRPEQETSIKVSEKSGKEMTYTLAVVDEGLLDLTRFKTPNAWDNFYVKEALGVKTWDVYDDVIGAYGGKVNQIFSIGGDQDLGGGKAKKANRFKPVVMYLGPFKLEKGQTKIHKIKLPKYIGSVRTMVVAANAKDAAYGSAEKATPVRSPLMILASLPRKVSPSENVTLPITVFAMEKHVKNVTLKLKASKGISVFGGSTQTVTFAQPDEKMTQFNLKIGNVTGIGKIVVEATSGKEKASYDLEFDIINPNPVTSTYKELILKPNSSGTIQWDAFGVAGTNKAKLEVSSFPSIDFNRRLDYLIQYPHGCVEQVTSGMFPQLYLADVMDIDQTRKQRIQRNLTAGIQKLSNYQLGNGGFSYWQGNTTADDWGTSYAGHFLLEAEKKGYALPFNFKKQWLNFQRKEAKQWRYTEMYANDFAQAYRLYTMALSGNPDLSSMNRLRETVGISNETKLRLAAAYALVGQKGVGLRLLQESAIDEVSSAGRYSYFGSAERNRAMTLETLVLLGQQQKAFGTAIKLAENLSSAEWMSTQTTAFGLYAMSKFAASVGNKPVNINYTFKGKAIGLKSAQSFAEANLEMISSSNSITIKNNKNATVYVKVIASGILPVGKEQVEQRGITTAITFKDRKGTPINVTSLKQGTEFVATIALQNTTGERVENMALTQILPSGWEIVNTRFTDYGDFAENQVEYTDIRDDRTNFYFSLNAGEVKMVKVLLNASYLGKYYLPGVQCEAMYDNAYFARTQGKWITVTK